MSLRAKRIFLLWASIGASKRVPLTKNSVKYTGFVAPGRGLLVSKAILEEVLREYINNNEANIYVDRIIISTLTTERNWEVLRRVLAKLIATGFYINLRKCAFARKEIIYLGSVIRHNEIKADPAKVQGIVEACHPKTIGQLRAFLGAAGYLRDFIPRYAELTAPLTDRLKKGARLVLGERERR
eukprot:GHVN01045630.1.p1 GENE.GHVN01045630.1~~GHVN01045630.1.p1  ORF type:complete len:184 (-),score=8.79 GHVN01045630.1:701-1252(-)